MPITTVALSNTFGEFRTTVNEIIDTLNAVSSGSGIINANTLTGGTVAANNLTSGRVTLANTAGQLTDDSAFTYDTATDILTLAGTTDASSSTTGTLKVAGGLGVAKKLYVGTDLNVSDSNFLNVGRIKSYSNASGGYILQNDNSPLYLGANNSYPLTVTVGTGVATSNVNITSNLTVGQLLTVTGNTTLSGATDASSSTTGAVIITGGVGIAKKLYVGTDLAVTGNTTLSGATDASSSTTGTFKVAGGVGIAKKLYVGTDLAVTGNTIITGDLTVNGTTTTINSTNLVVEDKNIVLADVATPTNVTADGGGITLKGATDKTFNWVNATAAWTSSEDLNLLTGKVYEINGTSVLSATTLGSNVTGSSLTSVGTIGTGVWQGTLIGPTYGGTGVNNAGRTITIAGNLSHAGAFTQTFTATANTTVTLPTTGTLVGSADTGTVTNTMLAGSIANAKLVNSSTTIGTTAISLGSSSTTLAGLTSVTSTSFVGAVTGNASTATTLQTARFINGVSFNGSANITITAAATNVSTQLLSLGVGTAASGNTGEIRATDSITSFFSDERLKNFHGRIEGALDKVQQLNGYYFKINDLAKELGYDNDRMQVGVSAQEVESVMPEVVTYAPISNEYKTVWYEKLVPLLIEAIKELKAEVDDLRTKVK